MEALGYIIGRHFALLAISCTHIHKNDKQTLVIENARKAFKLDPGLLMSVIGNPYKTTNIKKYILKLSSLTDKKSVESIIDDLNDVFNTSQSDMQKSIEKITEILSRHKRDDGHVDTIFVEQFLDTEEEIALLRDVTSSQLNNHFALCLISLLGYESQTGIMVANLIAAGNKIYDAKKDNLPDNQFFLQFLKAADYEGNEIQMAQELIKKLQHIIYEGWQNDTKTISTLLDAARPVLFEGICRLIPMDEKPNVVFYELSHRTDFEFLEPDIPLGNVEYNYKADHR